MSIVLAVLLAALLATVIAGVLILRPRRELHGLIIGRVVIVNIKGGLRGLVGVLVAVNRDTIVLANSRTLPGREKILGESVVPRDQIDWLQSDVPASLLDDVTE